MSLTANQKVERLVERLGQLTSGQRGFQRDGVRWRIHEFGIEHGALKIVASARRGGEILFTQDCPQNPFYFFNPPIMVPDGVETNPDYNAVDPRRRPTKPKHREDLLEAVKQMLAGMV
jgi:hypothetical protein